MFASVQVSNIFFVLADSRTFCVKFNNSAKLKKIMLSDFFILAVCAIE
jgi:hypothetical protein